MHTLVVGTNIGKAIGWSTYDCTRALFTPDPGCALFAWKREKKSCKWDPLVGATSGIWDTRTCLGRLELGLEQRMTKNLKRTRAFDEAFLFPFGFFLLLSIQEIPPAFDP